MTEIEILSGPNNAFWIFPQGLEFKCKARGCGVGIWRGKCQWSEWCHGVWSLVPPLPSSPSLSATSASARMLSTRKPSTTASPPSPPSSISSRTWPGSMLGSITKTALGLLGTAWMCGVSCVWGVRSSTLSSTGSIERTNDTGSSFPLLLFSGDSCRVQLSCPAVLLVISLMQSMILLTVLALSTSSTVASSSNVGGESKE